MLGRDTAAVMLSLLMACSGGGHKSPQATPTPTSTTSPSTASSATALAVTTTARPGPRPCAIDGLGVSLGEIAGAAGHQGVPVLFRNTSPSTCRLSGYPGVAGLDATGRQVTQARRMPAGYMGGLPPGELTSPNVVLAPGETASALVEATSVPEGTAPSCPQYDALLVTPPGETHSVRVAAGLPGCSGLQVHPVVPGTSGSLPR